MPVMTPNRPERSRSWRAGAWGLSYRLPYEYEYYIDFLRLLLSPCEHKLLVFVLVREACTRSRGRYEYKLPSPPHLVPYECDRTSTSFPGTAGLRQIPQYSYEYSYADATPRHGVLKMPAMSSISASTARDTPKARARVVVNL
eukprot:scaffold84276_cov40-Prasinocladus_malaysianus.AAC.1